MGRPCVCGASELDIDPGREVITVNGHDLRSGQAIAIDGSTGAITLDDVPLVTPEISEHFRRILEWADELRQLRVRANADAPTDAARARSFGAEGIGLCRTEHMFFGADRDRLVKEMFVAAEEWRRAHLREGRLVVTEDAPPTEVDEHFRDALARLQELQRGDFEGIFREMTGLPVTIRLLDPPLHEFLPAEHFQAELEAIEERGAAPEELERAHRTLALVHELHEANPMLGTRGVRLAVLYPPIYEMQVRAIIEAAAAAGAGAEKPHVEIMLPLIAYETELEHVRSIVVRAADRAQSDLGERSRTRSGRCWSCPAPALLRTGSLGMRTSSASGPTT